jgi:hypothetical protein
VLLLLLADEEGLHGRSRGERGARDGVGAHRHAAHGSGPQALRLGGHQLAERPEPLGQQDRALGVDVVLRRPAARERDFTDYERVLAQLRDQAVASAFSHVCRSARSLSGSVGGGR